MSTADLLAAIRDNPDDDTPRLVYADWCDDAGQPERAEFIRCQCARARLPDWHPQAREDRRRERVLLARHGRDWLAELGTVRGVSWAGFERGFVSEIRVTSAAACVAAAEVARAVAPIRAVTITADDPIPPAGTPAFPWLQSLTLTGQNVPADRLTAILDSPLAEHLRVLNLAGCGVENAGAAAIAAASHLTRLEELDLTDGFVGVAGALALAGARHLADLRVLRFDSRGSGYVDDPFIRAAGVNAIATSPYLRNLTTLGLSGHTYEDDVIGLVLTHPAFARLERVSISLPEDDFKDDLGPGPARWRVLELDGYGLGANSLTRLLALPQLSELRRLRLSDVSLTADGMRAVAESPAAAHLRELFVGGNYFGAGGAKAIADGRWPHLHTLDLKDDGIGPEGAAALARSGGLPALADLRLPFNDIGDPGAEALAGAAWAGGVRNFDAANNQIGPDGSTALAGSAGFRAVCRLDLSNNPLGPDGSAAVIAAELPELTDLDLEGTDGGDATARALAASPHVHRLLTLDLGRTGLSPDGLFALVGGIAGTDLGELGVGGNPALAEGGLGPLLAGDPLPRLRSLDVNNCGLSADAVSTLLASPVGTRVPRLRAWGNQTSQDVYRELSTRAWADLGPDWVPDGSEHDDPYA